MKMSTQIFNLRLFLEALKRLRVIGLATAILAVTASALVPIAGWLEYHDHDYVYEVETELLCVPVGLVTLLAPFFFVVLFSFLQKRKESDFFHAIPYTRTCVYVSFVTASLAFVWAIQLTCGLTAGILWKLSPNAILDLGGMAVYVLICMLASAMLSSFMMLALTVSGTAGSCMLLFFLFAGFVRVVVSIWGGCMDSIDLLSMDDVWNRSFVSPYWFLPINVLHYFSDIDASTGIMYSLPNILYSVLVTLAIYALAGLIYKHRKSEMAGSPAPGTKTQALFRIMFTMIPTLLISLFLTIGEDDPALHLVLVAVVLLVYFLYELITTKRPKNMLKAVPGLGIVAAGCILFSLAFAGYRSVVLNQRIEPDDISSVSVEANGLGPHTYQGRILNNFQTDDPDVVQIVAHQLAESQKSERTGTYGDFYWQRTPVTIRLKSGLTLRRQVILMDKDTDNILGNLRELEAMREILYKLPDDREIESGGVSIGITSRHSDYCHLDEDAYMNELMRIFRDEFGSLTDEQKHYVIAPTLLSYDWPELIPVTLTIRGDVDGRYFNSEYIISDDLPRTRNYLLTTWIRETYNYYQCGEAQWDGHSFLLLSELQNSMEDPKFLDIHENVTISLYAMSVENIGESRKNYGNEYIRVKAEILPALIGLLRERDLWQREYEPTSQAVTVTEDTYYLRIMVEGDYQEYSRLYLESSGLYNLTAEDWQTICDLLGVKNTLK